jgi:hypothetical protein
LSKRAARLLALAAAAGLAACSEFAPFETYAPPAPKGKTETGPRVAVCYDRLTNSQAAIAAAAQAQCPKGTAAARVGTDLTMQNCPLLLPSRAIFVCAPQK